MRKFTATLTALTLFATPMTQSWADSSDTQDDYTSTAEIQQPFGPETSKTTETHARVFPLVKYDREEEDTRLKVLHAPLVTVFEAKKNEDRHKVEVIDIPFFKLASTESETNGEFDNKFVKIPIFGSLFRHKRQGDKEKIRFLFFSHTRTVDPDQYSKDPYNKKPNHTTSRGKGAPLRN